jgi:hypothetical protein
VTARADIWSLVRLLLVQLAPKENGRSSGYTWPLIQPLHSLMSPRWMRLTYRLLLVLISPKESCFSCSYLAARAAAAFRAAKGAGAAFTEESGNSFGYCSCIQLFFPGLLDFSPNLDYLEMMERLRLTILSSSPMETKYNAS